MAPFADIKKIFSADDIKKSKKRSALLKAFARLEKKGEKIRSALKAEKSKKRKKELERKLETNERHQRKAKKIIKEVG